MSQKKNKKTDPPKSFAQAGTSKKSKKPILLVLAAVAAIAGISVLFLQYRKQITPGEFADYNVLFITLDTTRADHLPMYGYDQVKTPSLDRIAATSYVFEDAISHVPLTLPAHTSMLTSMLPISSGMRDNAGFFLDQNVLTLPEVFKTKGYATSAFVSAFVLDSRWQLNQGFDLYYDNFNLEEFKQLNPQDAQRRAEETEAEAEHWLEANKSRRFFSWVHFYDPHEPYDPPEPFKTEYADRPYDGEIAYMDVYVGKLIDKLKSMGVEDKTIVVITGDHGEGLGQHNEANHAMFVYNTTQHIPLLFHVPGGKNRRISGIVRHIDIAPTILDLLGVKPPLSFQGASLVPMMNGKKDTNRVAYSESLYAELHYGWSSLKSITTQQYKYIEAPKPELYDRIQDPGETRNLFQEKPNYAKVLREQLLLIISKYTNVDAQGPQKMDPETEERLRALGYIAGSVRSTEESRKIDPKDKIHLARDLEQASSFTQEQRYQEAVDLLQPILKEDPNMTDAHFIAGVSYTGIKNYDKGIDELLKTLALRPDHTMALYNIGYAYEMKDDSKNALDWYLKVLNYEPKHLYASLKVAHLYRQMNQPEKARPYFLQAMEVYQRFLANTKTDRAKSALNSTIGEIYFGAGEMGPAEEHYKAAIDLTPERSTLHYNLAMIYEAEGNPRGALDEYQKETEVDPKNYKAFNNLGLLYKHAGRLDLAAACFQKVVELLPDDPRGYVMLATTYKDMGRMQEAEAVMKKIHGGS